MPRVRVLRLMEYDFPSYEDKERIEGHGSVPFDGVKMFGNTVVRSATITTLYNPELEEDVPITRTNVSESD